MKINSYEGRFSPRSIDLEIHIEFSVQRDPIQIDEMIEFLTWKSSIKIRIRIPGGNLRLANFEKLVNFENFFLFFDVNDNFISIQKFRFFFLLQI